VALFDMQGMSRVERIIRETASSEITPRFRHLRPRDISEKSHGDPVTVADRTAEEILANRLQRLLPGSVVVGEERVADDPSLLTLLNGDEPVWIIDPIDGTRNFVAGNPEFATLVTLAHRGESVASWTYGPVMGITATALAGHGAWLNGERLRTAPRLGPLRGLRVATADEQWWPETHRRQYWNLRDGGVALVSLPACGLAYVDVARGTLGAMVLTWDLPWDHTAGALLVAEAGGTVLTIDGSAHQLAGSNALPFIATSDSATASALLATIQ
jgi:fructose-1,6-bisphosphatase/inositol monophosphatase family enzyme